jgi:hypothetical protein
LSYFHNSIIIELLILAETCREMSNPAFPINSDEPGKACRPRDRDTK